MTIFEFVRSRGWEPMINGLWARVNGHPASNCLSIQEVLEWEIVENLRQQKLQVIIDADSWGNNTVCVYERREYRMLAKEQADTAPMAICLAFLKLDVSASS